MLACETLTGPDLKAFNTFEDPKRVIPKPLGRKVPLHILKCKFPVAFRGAKNEDPVPPDRSPDRATELAGTEHIQVPIVVQIRQAHSMGNSHVIARSVGIIMRNRNVG